MICLKPFYLVVGVIVRISITKNKENITLTRSSIFSVSGNVPKARCGIFRDSMVREISKGFYGEYYMLIHVMCDLLKTENYTNKYPNIIEDYETEKKNITAKDFFSRIKLEKI